jgi:carboxylesterase type B
MMFCLDDEYGIFPYSMEEYSTKQLYEWCFETNVRNRIRNYQDVGVNYDSYKTHVSHGFTKDDPSYFRELIKLAGFSATTMSQIELIKSYHTANFITNKHIYLYCFEYVPDFNSFSLYPHDSDPTHMCELFFVFNHFVLGGENLLNVSSNDEEMSEIMSSL